MLRLVTLSTLLLLAAVLVTAGVSQFSDGAGMIAAGVLLAGWALLVFGEAP